MTGKGDKSLMEKYLEGVIRLIKYCFLTDIKKMDDDYAWAALIRHHRKNPPIDFNQILWESTEFSKQ